MAREHAEHFWPWNPKAACATPSTAESISASASTTIPSLPPISRMVRLIHTWPGAWVAALLLMSSPTSREPVNAMKRVLACATTTLPKLAPAPGQKFTTPSGIPASSSSSINFAAIVGESLEGFKITVLPQTTEASVIPAIIAQGKFHGGITAPTPSGI